jgi:undecaprenyl diphosphate synthase
MDKLKNRQVVTHLGIIPDGGRRWAQLRNIPLLESYRYSMSKLSAYTHGAFSHGTNAVSLYLLSKHNLKRTQAELAAVYTAESEFISSCLANLDARIIIAGNLTLVSSEFAEVARQAERETRGRQNTLFLCIAYDPQDELLSAITADLPKTTGSLVDALWVNAKLDIVIRTGGAKCLSDFYPFNLPMPVSYSSMTYSMTHVGSRYFVSCKSTKQCTC